MMQRRVIDEEVFAFEALLDKYMVRDVTDIMAHLEDTIDGMTSSDEFDYAKAPCFMLAVDALDKSLVRVWANPREIMKLPKR